NVDLLVNNITERLEDEVYDDVQGVYQKEPFEKPEEGEYVEEVERRPDAAPSPGYNSVATSSNLRSNPQGVSRDKAVMAEVSSALLEAQV
ncbi:hypothetical protein A2U01_0082296, partial [Trifolium medium]|nr:hypothetical protein [Trifolium medium]